MDETGSDKTQLIHDVLTGLKNRVDASRIRITKKLSPEKKKCFGQFMTPMSVASLVVSSFKPTKQSLRVLDPGAGVGSLTTALLAHLCSKNPRPKKIDVTAFEIDPELSIDLAKNLQDCQKVCSSVGVTLVFTIINANFLSVCSGYDMKDDSFNPNVACFDIVVMNPPYAKINSNSVDRLSLRKCGIETSNLYTGFMLLGARLLKRGGEFISITPRSFCNGPYFLPFRLAFLGLMSLKRIHIFESRQEAFAEDEVLQENIIVHARRERATGDTIVISSSKTSSGLISSKLVSRINVVIPGDAQKFIHIPSSEDDEQVRLNKSRFSHSLQDIGLTVSTGRVVDFRAKAELRKMPTKGAVPLIYPVHIVDSGIKWPLPDIRKPNALMHTAETESLLLPIGIYVIVKRFTAKEEKRRLVAAVLQPEDLPTDLVAIENHLNYFHIKGRGIGKLMAYGLALYLNSYLLDRFFRQFAGHTQVNATDLRMLGYPSVQQLEHLGKLFSKLSRTPEEIDQLLELI